VKSWGSSGPMALAKLPLCASLPVKRIGYLPENNPLYMDMGIVDYLEFISKVRDIPPSKRKDRIRHVVELCGLQKELGKDIGELSKGFRQRVKKKPSF